MKRILCTAAGGAPSINFTRSLRLAPEKFYIIGADADKYRLQRAEVDERFLAPPARDPDYIPFLNLLTAETGIQFLHTQNDQEVFVISENSDKLKVLTYLPPHRTVKICQDKFASYKIWEEAGLKIPKTLLIHNRQDLEKAFLTLGPMLWIRAVSGGHGQGSMPTSRLDEASAWIDFHHGWGSFCAAEYLSPQSTTWQSIWHQGNLVVAQGRKRLYWEFADRTPSGVTGLTGTGVTVSDPTLDDIAQKAILAVDPKPHGIFSVDLTYDKDQVPNPTEINIGRFFTTHLFFSAAGLNMPYILVKLAFNEEIPQISKRINPLPPGLAWVRGMDVEPILTTVSEIDSYEEELRLNRNRLRALV